MRTDSLGLYLHVPFCAAKCAYCDFYSLSGHAEQMDAYVAAAVRELERWCTRCTAYTIDTIYFGGGTPSMLGAQRLYTLLESVHALYSVAPDAEITVEANPDSMTDEFLNAAHLAGANRLSMGIQSADDGELKRLGRIHTFSQAQDAFHRARRAGFENISVDLMYALPDQPLERLQSSLARMLALEPEHVSCYGLTLEPNTPLARQNPTLPDEDSQADSYLTICSVLHRLGYEHYEISNFAKTSALRSRHNSRYWNQLPYLGIGPGAHSDFGGQRFFYPRDLCAFLDGSCACICEDDAPDRAAEYLMLGLRTADGICADEYEARFGQSFSPIAQALSPLIKSGHLVHENRRWHCTDSGFLISNAIILCALNGTE